MTLINDLFVYVFFFSSGTPVTTVATGSKAANVSAVADDVASAPDGIDMPVDPNEPTYCLCNQVSYGEMIGCDNSDVRLILNYLIFQIKYGKICNYVLHI